MATYHNTVGVIEDAKLYTSDGAAYNPDAWKDGIKQEKYWDEKAGAMIPYIGQLINLKIKMLGAYKWENGQRKDCECPTSEVYATILLTPPSEQTLKQRNVLCEAGLICEKSDSSIDLTDNISISKMLLDVTLVESMSSKNGKTYYNVFRMSEWNTEKPHENAPISISTKTAATFASMKSMAKKSPVTSGFTGKVIVQQAMEPTAPEYPIGDIPF